MKLAFGVSLGVTVGVVLTLFARPGALPSADAQAGPAGGAGANGVTVLGTGGGTQNQNDLCWVLAKVKPVKGPERTVLALYRAERQGDFFNLKDVRAVDADLRVIELDAKKHEPTVDTIMKALPKPEADALRPPRD